MVKNAEFATHILNPIGMEKARDIAHIFDDTLEKLSHLCISGREWALVKTHMETACFFAKKSMATNLNNQQGAGCTPPQKTVADSQPSKLNPTAPTAGCAHERDSTDQAQEPDAA